MSSSASVSTPLYQSLLQSNKSYSTRKTSYILFPFKHSPFGYLTSPIAFSSLLIESLSELATTTSWGFSINAHIEELAVLRIGITRMCCSDAFIDFWASKVEKISRSTSSLLCFIRPVANASFLGEHQTIGTCDHVEFAFNAVVEGVAISHVLVTKIAVHSWTMRRWFWLLCNSFTILIHPIQQ